VAFGVLLDAIIVRSVLVTALNHDIGSKVWWPSKLAHEALPDEDLSGELETVGSGAR
jgi:RND superfamily putative drug exporter